METINKRIVRIPFFFRSNNNNNAIRAKPITVAENVMECYSSM